MNDLFHLLKIIRLLQRACVMVLLACMVACTVIFYKMTYALLNAVILQQDVIYRKLNVIFIHVDIYLY